MSPKQKKLAAKAPPPNKIDAKDFAVLRAEKAKGRGMGLQDEKVQPGKVMKAKRGKFLRSDPTKPISSVKPLGKLGGAGSMKVSKAHSSVLGKISANKLREMVKTGMNPDLKGDPNIKRGSQKTSMEAKSTLDKVNKKNSSEFLKRRKELGAAGKALSATRIGKIALGVGAAGVAAQQYLKSKMKKKDEPKKKMGGGMMKKYSKGGGSDMGKSPTSKMKVAEIVRTYALANSMKDKDRLTDRDIDMAKKAISRVKAKRAQQGFLRTDPMPKKWVVA